LYQNYAASLYAVALRYTKSEEDAQDVLHDAFLRILNSLELFEGKCMLYTWLARIVINHALTMQKKQSKVVMEDYSDYEEKIADEPISDSEKLTHQVLLDFIRELTPRQQAVFNLCEMEGYSYKEAVKMLKISESRCRKLLYSAKDILRKKVNDFLENENKYKI
jgi:RNA polymerase sigma-70 factor (ECF subfamily)